MFLGIPVSSLKYYCRHTVLLIHPEDIVGDYILRHRFHNMKVHLVLFLVHADTQKEVPRVHCG